MALELNGTTGVSAVQAGAVESGDLPAGSVIQVVQESYTDEITTTSTSFSSLGITASITPSNSNNKVLVLVSAHCRIDENSGFDAEGDLSIFRNGSSISTSTELRHYDFGGSGAQVKTNIAINNLDSPNTTSEVNYALYGKLAAGNNFRVNDSGESTITLMEIAG